VETRLYFLYFATSFAARQRRHGAAERRFGAVENGGLGAAPVAQIRVRLHDFLPGQAVRQIAVLVLDLLGHPGVPRAVVLRLEGVRHARQVFELAFVVEGELRVPVVEPLPPQVHVVGAVVAHLLAQVLLERTPVRVQCAHLGHRFRPVVAAAGVRCR